MKLWRPVGLEELVLIFESGCTRFPRRLPEQPIFYPVLSRNYAVQIARDWNSRSVSGAGYVTSFSIPDGLGNAYERHVVGGREHEELWVPAAELNAFNAQIEGGIRFEEAFFGPEFRGLTARNTGLSGRNAIDQLVVLGNLFSDSSMDFFFEVSSNRTAVFANYAYWLVAILPVGTLADERRAQVCEAIGAVWRDLKDVPPLMSAASII